MGQAVAKYQGGLGEPLVQFQIAPGMTVQEVINAANIPPALYDAVVVLQDGVMISDWSHVLQDGESLTICAVPQKGAIQALAIVAVAIAAPFLAPSVLGAVGVAATATTLAVATAGISLVGSLLVTALIPPPSVNAQPGPARNEEALAFNLSGQSNQSNMYGGVPSIYGKVKFFPYLASAPEITTIGKISSFAAIYDFGLGDLEVTSILVGDQPYAQLGLTANVIRGKITSTARVKSPVNVEQFSYGLNSNNDSVTLQVKAGTTYALVELDFNRGLTGYANDGSLTEAKAKIIAEYRESGTGTWTAITGWNTADGVSYNAATNELVGKTAQPSAATISFDTPDDSKAYELRFTRVGDASQDTRLVNNAVLAQLRSYKAGSPFRLKRDHTMIELYGQASDKLTGSVQNLSAVVSRKIRTCTTTGWGPVAETSNPAYIALDILAGAGNSKPLKDAQIDFASFKRLADLCEQTFTYSQNGRTKTAKRFEFNGVLMNTTVQSAVNDVLGNARAQLIIGSSGKFGVLIDEQRSTPRQLITPANSWGFSAARSFPIYPDALRVSYVEPELDWAMGEVVVYADGKDDSNSEVYDDLKLQGVVDYGQAWRQGRYMMAQGRMRNEIFTVTMDVENLAVVRGDLVAVQHDAPKMGGQAVRVKSVAGAVVTVDQFVSLPPNAGYTVRLVDGTIKTGAIASSTDDQITLAAADPDIGYDDLMVLGEQSKTTSLYIVLAVTPGPDLTAQLTLVQYVDGVYTADTGSLPTWDPGFGKDVISGTDLAVFGVNAAQTLRYVDRMPFVDILIQWQMSGNLGTLKDVLVVAKIPGQPDLPIGNVNGTQVTWTIDPLKHPELMNKDVTFVATPMNTLGNTGTPGQTTLRPVPDTTSPPAPEGYGVNILNNSLVEIFWHTPAAPDLAYYEVRYTPEVVNPQWSHGQKIAFVGYETTRTTAGARTGSYMIQSIDTSGNRSATKTLRTSVETLPDLNLLRELDDAPNWNGSKVDVVKDGAVIRLDGPYGAVPPLGYYAFDTVYDAGEIQELRVMAMLSGYGVTDDDVMARWIPLNTAKPLARASASDFDYWAEVSTADKIPVMADWVPLNTATPIGPQGAGWQPWRRFESVDVTGRLFKFRIVMRSNNPNVNIKMLGSKITIDVMERVWSQQNINVTNAAGGVRVDFTPPFRSVPTLAVTIDGNAANVIYEVVSKSQDNAVIRLIDTATKAPTTGRIDVAALGEGRIRTKPL